VGCGSDYFIFFFLCALAITSIPTFDVWTNGGVDDVNYWMFERAVKVHISTMLSGQMRE
jgi:hypothetical protein